MPPRKPSWYATGRPRAAELVEAAIEAAQRVNPQINAIIHPRYDSARAEAAASVGASGPFAGVPMVVKDLGCMMKGEPYHLGSRGLKSVDYRAPVDSALYRRFREAGFVAIGRTNAPEMGSTITTEPLAYGPSRNPWNLDYSTGGSSGGSAAAVGAGIVAVGHANDGGGSIRVAGVGVRIGGPEAEQGPCQSERLSSARRGPARRSTAASRGSVRDTAAVLDAISGYEPGDPYIAPPFARPLVEEVGADPGRLRIGVLDRSPLVPSHPDCEAAVASVAKLLESLGHHIDDSSPAAMSDLGFQDRFVTVVAANTAARSADHGGQSRSAARRRRPRARQRLLRRIGQVGFGCRLLADSWRAGHVVPRDDVVVAPARRQRRSRSAADTRHRDASAPDRLPVGARGRRCGSASCCSSRHSSTSPASRPSACRLYWTADGLPVGVQLVAGFGREDVLVRVAAQLEAAQPVGVARAPPVSA